jgi:hypothetical protein
MWSVLRIFLSERGEADFASDCTDKAIIDIISKIGFLSIIISNYLNNICVEAVI